MQIFSIIIHKINKLFSRPSDPLYENKKSTLLDTDSYANRYIIISNLYLNNVLIKNIQKVFQPKIIINPTIKLPKYYYEFLLVFD
jgi:hypothetical protein